MLSAFAVLSEPGGESAALFPQRYEKNKYALNEPAAVSRADLAVDTTRCEAESACPRRSKTRAGACPPEALVPLLTTATGTVALSPPLRAWETDGPISR